MHKNAKTRSQAKNKTLKNRKKSRAEHGQYTARALSVHIAVKRKKTGKKNNKQQSQKKQKVLESSALQQIPAATKMRPYLTMQQSAGHLGRKSKLN